MKLHVIKFENGLVLEECGLESWFFLWFLVKNQTYSEETASILSANLGSYVPYLFNCLIIVSIR